MQQPLPIRYSAVTTFMACPRRHYYQYHLGLQRVGEVSRPLEFGTAFHSAQYVLWTTDAPKQDRLQAALDVWDGAVGALAWEDWVIGRVLLIGYAARWDDEEYRVHTIPIGEQRIFVPLNNPEGVEDPDIVLSFQMDIGAHDREGKTVIGEHKTTQSDLGGELFWERMQNSLQPDTYMIGSAKAGRPTDYLLLDAIRAPALRRKKATPPENRKYYVKGPKAGQIYEGQRETDETKEEFMARVMEEIMVDPTKYFQRRKFTRTADELYDSECDIWAWGSLMHLAATGKNGIPLAPRNRKSCHDFNTPCAFIPLCWEGASTDDKRLYQIRKSNGQ